MLKVDKDSVICDFAETYGVFDIYSLKPTLLATLACGLRDDSRIKKKLSSSTLSFEQLLLVSIFDSLKLLLWAKSEDGSKNINRPASLLKHFLGEEEKENDYMTFEDEEEFERIKKIINEGE